MTMTVFVRKHHLLPFSRNWFKDLHSIYIISHLNISRGAKYGQVMLYLTVTVAHVNVRDRYPFVNTCIGFVLDVSLRCSRWVKLCNEFKFDSLRSNVKLNNPRTGVLSEYQDVIWWMRYTSGGFRKSIGGGGGGGGANNMCPKATNVFWWNVGAISYFLYILQQLGGGWASPWRPLRSSTGHAFTCFIMLI